MAGQIGEALCCLAAGPLFQALVLTCFRSLPTVKALKAMQLVVIIAIIIRSNLPNSRHRQVVEHRCHLRLQHAARHPGPGDRRICNRKKLSKPSTSHP